MPADLAGNSRRIRSLGSLSPVRMDPVGKIITMTEGGGMTKERQHNDKRPVGPSYLDIGTNYFCKSVMESLAPGFAASPERVDDLPLCEGRCSCGSGTCQQNDHMRGTRSIRLDRF